MDLIQMQVVGDKNSWFVAGLEKGGRLWYGAVTGDTRKPPHVKWTLIEQAEAAKGPQPTPLARG